jgi:hypothetical protein
MSAVAVLSVEATMPKPDLDVNEQDAMAFDGLARPADETDAIEKATETGSTDMQLRKEASFMAGWL